MKRKIPKTKGKLVRKKATKAQKNFGTICNWTEDMSNGVGILSLTICKPSD